MERASFAQERREWNEAADCRSSARPCPRCRKIEIVLAQRARALDTTGSMATPLATDPFGALAPVPPAGDAGTPTSAPPGSLAELESAGAAARADLSRWLTLAQTRARRLLLGQRLLVLAASLVAALLFGAGLAARTGPLPGRVLAALLAFAIPLSLLFASRRSLLSRASRSDRNALGRLLIAHSPHAGSYGSELLSSIEIDQAPPPGSSGALLALLHQRAARTARAIDLRLALPSSNLRAPALGLIGTLAAAGLFALAAPQPLRLGLSRLWLGEAATPAPDLEPIVGDLSVTYLYPAYTNLPARVEEGTPGDLRGPKGTEIKLTARADRDVAQAFAVIDGTPVKLEASGAGNRLLSGNFTLSKPGHWRFRFADKKGRPVVEGPDRSIEVVADQPPQATIVDPHKSETEVDPAGKLPIVWSAQDDYGIGKVALVYQRAGDAEQRVELAAPTSSASARRLNGTYAWEMSSLALREGDNVTFRVEVYDQDAIDGPQKGSSAIHSLKVFSAAEHHKEGIARAQALWERLVLLTSERIDEQVHPAFKFSEAQSRDAHGLQLTAELRKAGDELAKDKLAPRALGRALKNIATSLSPLLQRTIMARAPFATPGAALAGAQKQLTHALETEIREEEKDILYLDDLLDQARIDDLQELQREMKRSREELKRLAEKLRNAPDEATKKQVLAEVQRLRERVTELMKRMAEMSKSINDEHLNEDAMKSADKEDDALAQLADVQKKLQSGDVDGALKELDNMSKNLDQLEKALAKQAEESGAEKYAEEAKELKGAAQKLAQLESREQELEKRTGRLRKELRGEAKKRFEENGGKQLAQKLVEKVAEAKKQVAKIDPHISSLLGLDDTLDAAQERVADLERALKAGDYQEALEQSSKAEHAAEMLQGRLNVEDQLRQFGQPVEVRKSLEAAAGANGPLRDVTQALKSAMPDEQSLASPEQRAEMQSQEAEQKEIAQGMKGVRQQMSEVGKKVPIFSPQHEQMLEQAQGAMEQASEKLGQKQPRGAEGAESEALDKLGKFQEAMKEMAKNGSGSGAGMPMPWGEPSGSGQGSGEGGDEEGDGEQQKQEHVEIPDAESSRGPQEFRKKLLDAMKQPAPQSFREKVRGYYEELVK